MLDNQPAVIKVGDQVPITTDRVVANHPPVIRDSIAASEISEELPSKLNLLAP